MDWSERLYRGVFHDHIPDFALRENDYVAGQRKFGGNAQSISGPRWVHHTSFLWDFKPQHMALLANPAKQPEYRGKREHVDFLCHFLSDHTLLAKISICLDLLPIQLFPSAKLVE